MVQSEVADRLVAKPNSKTYGSPSVKATWWADLTSAGTVSRSIFWPVPNVDSSLVRFVRQVVFKIIDAAFAQRRKMMRAALSDMCGGSAAASSIIEASGIDPTIRGEALELSDFIKIAITLSK
jgi:16S rRNA (adenine1518-N6/adenine1519-N6)-dimethyltransferase